MRQTRELRLSRERLAELTPAELASLGAGNEPDSTPTMGGALCTLLRSSICVQTS